MPGHIIRVFSEISVCKGLVSVPVLRGRGMGARLTISLLCGLSCIKKENKCLKPCIF